MDVENANCKLRLSQCSDMEVLPIERPLKIDVEITGLDMLIQELHNAFSREHVNVQDVQKLMAGYKSEPKDWKKFAKFDRFRYTRNLVDAGNGAFNIMILCWGPGHASAIHDHADSHCFMKLLSGSLEEVRYAWPENVEPEVVKKLKNNNKWSTCCSGDKDEDLNDKMADLSLDIKNENCANDDNKSRQENKKCKCGNSGCINGECENSGYEDGGNECAYGNGGNECTYGNGGNEYEEVGYTYKDVKEIRRTRLNVNDVCYINDALGLHRMENPSYVDGAVSLHLYCPPFDSCRVFDARTGKPTEVKVTFWSMYGKKIKRVIEANEITDSQ